jgi:adenine phosphoribosyltransferase
LATRKRSTVTHAGPARRAPTPRGKAPGTAATAEQLVVQQALRHEPEVYLRNLVRSVPDFPKPGILFRDISPVLADPRGFAFAVEAMSTRFIGTPLDAVVAVEARGFMFGSAIAHRLGLSFVPVRKPGKLPCAVDRVSYALEYGREELQMHKDALKAGARVLLVDDVLATGGTAAAACELVTRAKCSVVACTFLIELVALDGAARLPAPLLSVLKY